MAQAVQSVFHVSLKSFCSRKPVLNTIAFEGLDASNNNAADDESATISAHF